jgi:hypothetical protein
MALKGYGGKSKGAAPPEPQSLSLSVRPDQLERLRFYARIYGGSVHDIIRSAIDAHLRHLDRLEASYDHPRSA